MPNTYKALLKGNHLEWLDDPPTNPNSDQPVRVAVSILEEHASLTHRATQGQKMADALEKLAALNALPDITDAEAWQREVRQDRTLPGRGA
jgi:hypothetical protein